MKKLIAILVLALSMPALADSEIVLNDGSRIRGEILSMQNGLYKVQTQSMGVVSLGSAQIRSISKVGAGASADSVPSTSSLAQESMQSIQSSIANSPGLMSNIMELRDDPQMQEILRDPEIMDAVQRLDFQALQNNPKMKALMNNRKIKEISGSIK